MVVNSYFFYFVWLTYRECRGRLPKFDRPKDNDHDERSPAINGLGKKHPDLAQKAEQGSAATTSSNAFPAWGIALIGV
jgi:hypothetical protein